VEQRRKKMQTLGQTNTKLRHMEKGGGVSGSGGNGKNALKTKRKDRHRKPERDCWGV